MYGQTLVMIANVNEDAKLTGLERCFCDVDVDVEVNVVEVEEDDAEVDVVNDAEDDFQNVDVLNLTK